MELNFSEIKKTILTHHLTPMGPLPTVLDPNGVYPYQSFYETSTRPIIKQYDFIKLENRFLQVLICQDLGGKVYSITHKGTDTEVLYVPDVIRGSRILPRFYFVAGGIEVSFPISHTPSQNEKVNYEISRERDRIYVCVGETELRYGMQWTVEYSLGENDQFLTQRTLFNNPTQKAHSWMSWSNAAVPAYDDTVFHFPNGRVLCHSDEMKTIDWKSEGPDTNADIENMSGYFWQNPDVNAFGIYSPSKGIGLYHVADQEQMPGIKLWSYGSGRDQEWSYLSSLSKQAYLEIQAGPISNQSIKYQLEPGTMHCHTEFWFPSIERMDIRKLSLPEIMLRPMSEVPLFSFAREEEVQIWKALIGAYEKLDTLLIPKPPEVNLGLWPPSGLYNLEEPFKWAIAKSIDKSFWQYYYGIWLVAIDKIDDAIPHLHDANMDIGHAVLARIYKHTGDYQAAKKHYNLMKTKAMLLHPQIVTERDSLLEKFGERTLSERMKWLEKVNALPDEMIIERRIALLIDLEKYEEARHLFIKTDFQKIHQRYARKRLWKKLCKKTKTSVVPYPKNLGEDDLAEFGKYREFEDK